MSGCRLLAFGLLLAATIGSAAAMAQSLLPMPTGPTILTVTGAIDRTNVEGEARFDQAMLEGLGVWELVTSTPWTDGRPTFRGVRARDVMQAVGARGTTVTGVALNDYRLEIPISDFETYPVLLAFAMNNVALTARDKGPLWIVYPRDRFEELRTPATREKSIWQLHRFEVK